MLNHVLQSLGIIKGPLNWLSDPALAMGATAVLQIWGTFPFVMLMVSAGLQSIDGSVLDAARVDGAGWFSEAVHIILPALRNVMFIVAVDPGRLGAQLAHCDLDSHPRRPGWRNLNYANLYLFGFP